MYRVRYTKWLVGWHWYVWTFEHRYHRACIIHKTLPHMARKILRNDLKINQNDWINTTKQQYKQINDISMKWNVEIRHIRIRNWNVVSNIIVFKFVRKLTAIIHRRFCSIHSYFADFFFWHKNYKLWIKEQITTSHNFNANLTQTEALKIKQQFYCNNDFYSKIPHYLVHLWLTNSINYTSYQVRQIFC